MSSDDSEIENTGDENAAEETAAEETTAESDTVELDKDPVTETVETGSAATGVAAKAKAKAQAREAQAADAQDKQFTVSARTLKTVAVGLVGVVVIAVAAFFGWKWYDTKQELNAFSDSKAAASHYITEYFGALLEQGGSADELKARVGPLSTGDQKEQIETSAAETVKWRDTQKLENVKTTINSTMVESFSKDHAVTVVSFEFTGTSATAPGGGRAVTLIQVTLDKIDGDWLVSNIQAVPGMGGESTDQGGAVPGVPTETAPAPAEQPAG